MAILHHATLEPSKLELLAGWLPGQPWAATLRPDDALERVAAFRFDDPAGQVGVETLIVRASDGPSIQVPLTYRDSPRAGGDRWLIGTLHHSVLGTRWVYDATGDPVYIWTASHAILAGGREAEQFYDTPHGPERKLDPTHVVGSGTNGSFDPQVDRVTVTSDAEATTVVFDSLRLLIHRALRSLEPSENAQTLTGTWDGQEAPLVLAEIAIA